MFILGGNIIENEYYQKKYILDGMGKSNLAIKNFFEKNNIVYICYDDKDENQKEIAISNYDYLIKSPGVPLSQSLIARANKEKIEVISDLELFYRFKPHQLYVSVTGSNGKTTIVYFIHQLLQMANVKHQLAGNIGIPLFSIIEEVEDNELILIEASSYMLEATNTFSPLIHVITNIYPHHLEHHQTFINYFNAKVCPLIKRKQPICFYPVGCQPIDGIIKENNLEGYPFGISNEKKTIKIQNNLLFLPTKTYYINNLDKYSKIDQNNLCISLGVLNCLKRYFPKLISIDSLITKIDNLKKYPLRQEIIINNDKIQIINDSKATNYYATRAAVLELIDKAVNCQKIIILGGKNQDYLSKSFAFMNNFDFAILYGENRFILNNLINKYVKTIIVDTLEEGVKIIQEKMTKKISNNEKLLILFSPMAASLDQYQSYIERGENFNDLVVKYLLHP